MLTNNKINDVHASRYIASWLRVGGKLITYRNYDDFKQWLSSLGLDKEEIYHIYNMASCGKMELEKSARLFMEQLNR